MVMICKEIKVPFDGTVMVNTMVSATLDSDEPVYVIVSTSAVSFIILGGLQLDYTFTVSLMLGLFALLSCGDVLRIYLAYRNYDSLANVITGSHMIQTNIRTVTTELRPSNVY